MFAAAAQAVATAQLQTAEMNALIRRDIVFEGVRSLLLLLQLFRSVADSAPKIDFCGGTAVK